MPRGRSGCLRPVSRSQSPKRLDSEREGAVDVALQSGWNSVSADVAGRVEALRVLVVP